MHGHLSGRSAKSAFVRLGFRMLTLPRGDVFTAGGRSVGLGVTTTDATERAEAFRSVEGRGEEGPPGETQPRHRHGRRRVGEAAGPAPGRDWLVGRRGEEGTGQMGSTRRGAARSLTHLFLRSSLPVRPLREPMPSVDRVSRCWKGSPRPCCQRSPDAGRPRPMLRGRCPPLQGTDGGFVRGATVLGVQSDMAVVVVVVQSRCAVRAITRVCEFDSHFDFRALLPFTRSLTPILLACTLLQTAQHPESATISIRAPMHALCIHSRLLAHFWPACRRAYSCEKRSQPPTHLSPPLFD